VHPVRASGFCRFDVGGYDVRNRIGIMARCWIFDSEQTLEMLIDGVNPADRTASLLPLLRSAWQSWALFVGANHQVADEFATASAADTLSAVTDTRREPLRTRGELRGTDLGSPTI